MDRTRGTAPNRGTKTAESGDEGKKKKGLKGLVKGITAKLTNKGRRTQQNPRQLPAPKTPTITTTITSTITRTTTDNDTGSRVGAPGTHPGNSSMTPNACHSSDPSEESSSETSSAYSQNTSEPNYTPRSDRLEKYAEVDTGDEFGNVYGTDTRVDQHSGSGSHSLAAAISTTTSATITTTTTPNRKYTEPWQLHALAHNKIKAPDPTVAAHVADLTSRAPGAEVLEMSKSGWHHETVCALLETNKIAIDFNGRGGMSLYVATPGQQLAYISYIKEFLMRAGELYASSLPQHIARDYAIDFMGFALSVAREMEFQHKSDLSFLSFALACMGDADRNDKIIAEAAGRPQVPAIDATETFRATFGKEPASHMTLEWDRVRWIDKFGWDKEQLCSMLESNRFALICTDSEVGLRRAMLDQPSTTPESLNKFVACWKEYGQPILYAGLDKKAVQTLEASFDSFAQKVVHEILMNHKNLSRLAFAVRLTADLNREQIFTEHADESPGPAG